jgi:hypothetical protein
MLKIELMFLGVRVVVNNLAHKRHVHVIMIPEVDFDLEARSDGLVVYKKLTHLYLLNCYIFNYITKLISK